MQTRKTILSYFIWVLGLLVIGGLYATVSYTVALTLCGGQSLYAILIAGAVALFFIVLYFLSKCFLAKKWNLLKVDRSKFVEFVLPTLILVGVIARLIVYVYMHSPIVISDGRFYHNAMITAVSEPITFVANGLQNLYILILHGLFFLLGNNPLVGVVFDICCYFITLVLLLFILRRISGNLVAALVVGLIGFLPNMTNFVFTMTPVMFGLFLFVLLLSVTSKLMEKFQTGEGDLATTSFYAIFVGLLLGVGLYLDLRYVTILFFLPSLFFLKDSGEAKKNLVILTLLELLGLVGGFALSLLGGGYYFQKGLSISNSYGQYASQYVYDPEWSFNPFVMPDYAYVMIVILGFALLSIFSFVLEKRNRITLFYWNFLLLLTAEIFLIPGIVTEPILTLSICIIAALGFAGMFVPFGFVYETETQTEDEQIEEMDNSEIKNIDEISTVVNPMDETEPVIEEAPAPKIAPGAPLPNPLPVPKKRERKGMDYGKEIAEDDLHYDVEVRDDDDFDIQL